MDRMGAVVVVLVTLVLTSACARFPVAPAEGGPVWTELVSEHFTVWTDAESSPVYDLILRMEKFHQVTTGVVYATTPSSGRVIAVVMASDRELREISPSDEPRAFAA